MLATLTNPETQCHIQKRYWWVPLVVLLPLAVGLGSYVSVQHQVEVEHVKAEFSKLVQSLLNSRDPTMIVDAEGNIIAANRAAASVCGIDIKTLRGMNVDKLVPLRYQDAHHNGIQRWSDNLIHGSGHRECSLRLPDDSEIPVNVKFQSFVPDGQLVFDVKIERVESP